jgi:hypothetical protein
MMGFTTPRLHHSVKWRNTTPMIIKQKHKKWKQEKHTDQITTTTNLTI